MSNRSINYCDPKRVIRSLGYARSGVHKSTLVNNSATARFVFMGAPGSVAQFKWSNFIDCDLKSYLYYTRGLTALWPYYRNNQLLQVCNATPTNVISQYDYGYDVAGRRISCAKSGSAFTQDDTVAYGYNSRSELTNAAAAVDSAYRYSYAFDDIGNREAATERGTNSFYAANKLNQYTSISNFVSSVSFVANEFSPQFDDDGNQTLIKTATGVWQVFYNGENRPIFWSNGTTNIIMQFDRMGRRVQYLETCGVTTNSNNTFTYDNYLLIARNHHSPDGMFTTDRFVWDVTEPIVTRPLVFYCPNAPPLYYSHDGNKNVSNITSLFQFIFTYCEYAPFGVMTVVADEANSANTYNVFGFSSEYTDKTLKLTYYIYRHYSILDGRWISRDPLEEMGVISLYCMTRNDTISSFDRYGLLGWRGRHRFRSKHHRRSGKQEPVIRGVRTKNGIKECRTHEQRKDYSPTVNGCGSGWNTYFVPDMDYLSLIELAWIDFSKACNEHDKCYGTCGSDKGLCNDMLARDMKQACDKLTYRPLARYRCHKMADLYKMAVDSLGESPWQDAQDEACEWKPCDQVCPKEYPFNEDDLW